MRSTMIAYCFLFLLLSCSAYQIPSVFTPFFPPHLDGTFLSNSTLIIPGKHDLLKRNGNCPANFNSCSKIAGGSEACCNANAVCTMDFANNVACCNKGATCTGTINPPTAASTATMTGATYVSNAFFPFPYIPTTYINSAACMTAYSACQTNYALCTQDVGGGGFAVTVSAPGGGITVAPTITALGAASATSICSSLSDQACSGLQTSNCAAYGTATTTGGGFVIATNAAARPTVGCLAAAGMMAGVGLGIAGQFV